MSKYAELGHKVDKANDDANEAALHLAICEIEKALEQADSDAIPELYYFRANAFSGLKKIKNSPNLWLQPETTEEILSLRTAQKSEAFRQLHVIRRAQILTNLGNALVAVGRPIDAIAAWDEALTLIPSFAMAAGNRGYGLISYASVLHDPSYQFIFLSQARKSYENALALDAIWDSGRRPGVVAQFVQKLSNISVYLDQTDWSDVFEPSGGAIGQNAEEQQFHQWRLDHRLFLNPLNDLGAWPDAAKDVMHLPDHSYAFDDKIPRFVKLFDLTKQEYVAACVLLWEGRFAGSDDMHPADRRLLVYDHGDYSVSSIRHEKQKAALRLAYSLLDKSAVFINDFFHIGKNPRQVSFRNVWFSDRACKNLHPNLPINNGPLRGLFALSLDVYDPQLTEHASPVAAKVSGVRNAAEHRFLSVHEFAVPQDRLDLCDYVTEGELYHLSLHIIRLARSALMGLSMAMHVQEHAHGVSEADIVLPFTSLPRHEFEAD